MFKAASACSTQTNATSAATECVAQVAAAGIARADFVVVHANCALSLREIGRVLRERWPGVRLVNFGHLGDGNLHYNVQAPAGQGGAEFLAQHEHAVNQVVFDSVAEEGGSFSAEHGIGALRRRIHLVDLPPLGTQRVDVRDPLLLSEMQVDRRTFDVGDQAFGEARTGTADQSTDRRHVPHVTQRTGRVAPPGLQCGRRMPHRRTPLGATRTAGRRERQEHTLTGNSSFTHRNTGVLSVEAVEPPEAVSSDWIDEQLADGFVDEVRELRARPGGVGRTASQAL
jgi:hypothetical protein